MNRLTIAAGLLLSLTAEAAIARSQLPPSNPGAAIQLGPLDEIQSSSAVRLLPCVGYEVVLTYSNRYYNTQYFKFDLTYPNSTLVVKMIEDPDATLWFLLRDKNLNQIGSPFKGGDDQELEVDNLQRGTYYVQVVTDENMRRLPDGTNRAFVVLKAEPQAYRKPLETLPINLGTVTTAITKHEGVVVLRNTRIKNFRDRLRIDRNCPALQGTSSNTIRLYNEYSGRAPKGKILVSSNVIEQQAWPRNYPFKMYYKAAGDWRELTNHGFDHPGGEFRIAVGHIANFTATPGDAYIHYVLSVSRSRGGFISSGSITLGQ